MKLAPVAFGITLAFCGTLAPLPAAAQQLSDDRPHGEIALSDETLQIRYIDNGAQVDAGRGSRASGGFFLSEERDIVMFGDLLFPARFGYERFEVLFGPRAYVALLEEENTDIFTLTLGAEMRFELDPGSGLAVAAQAFYGPDILTFGSADNLTDLSARLEVRLQERLVVFGGMRWFEFDLTDDQGTQTLQEELFAGASWRF
jgi:hypothetical protein